MRSTGIKAAAAALALLAAGCMPSQQGPNWRITERQQSFDELDQAQRQQAPAVADAVTSDRIARAGSEPHNWLTYYGTYDGHRFANLDQINPANVRSLAPAWVFQVGALGLLAAPATYALEAAPIVVDGVMYLSGWDGYVWALDAATGEELWRFQHAVSENILFEENGAGCSPISTRTAISSCSTAPPANGSASRNSATG